MGLINNGIRPTNERALTMVASVQRCCHHALGHIQCRVPGTKRKLLIRAILVVAKLGFCLARMPCYRTCIRLQNQFVMVKAMAEMWLIRPIHAIAIEYAGLQSRHVAVPYMIGALW